jgi:hypothetical protein
MKSTSLALGLRKCGIPCTQVTSEDHVAIVPKPLTASERLKRTVDHFAREEFSRKHYLELFRTLSTATASRDLKAGVDQGCSQSPGKKASPDPSSYGTADATPRPPEAL